MGSEGRNLKKAGKVRKSEFRRRWEIFVALVISGILPEILDRRNLITLGHAEFPPNTIDDFLQTALDKGRLELVGQRSPRQFLVIIDPMDRLPEALQPFYEQLEVQQELLNALANVEHQGTKTLTKSDIQLVLFDLTSEEVTDAQLAIIIAKYLGDGLIERAEGGAFRITDAAREQHIPSLGPANRTNNPPDPAPELHGAAAGGESENAGDRSPREAELPPPRTTSSRPSALPMVVLTEGIPGVSADQLNRLFPLFLEVGFRVFRTEAQARSEKLGFVSKAAFTIVLVHLHKAGVLIDEGRGKWRWNIKKVPAKWIAALRQAEEVVPPPEAPGEVVLAAEATTLPSATESTPPPALPPEEPASQAAPAVEAASMEPETEARADDGGGVARVLDPSLLDGLTGRRRLETRSLRSAQVASGDGGAAGGTRAALTAAPEPVVKAVPQAPEAPDSVQKLAPTPAVVSVPVPAEAASPVAIAASSQAPLMSPFPPPVPATNGQPSRAEALEREAAELRERLGAMTNLVALTCYRQFFVSLPPESQEELLRRVEQLVKS